jgi:hypothetical protein
MPARPLHIQTKEAEDEDDDDDEDDWRGLRRGHV